MTEWEDRARISLLLYLGSAMMGLSGLLYAIAVASMHGEKLPPSYSDYAQAISVMGFAIVLVGFARQARRMRE